jgi:LysM repeat protein
MRIAKTHGTTVKAIQSENNLVTTKINVGQKLKIPVKAAAVAPAPLVEPAPAFAAPVMPESMPVVEPAK